MLNVVMVATSDLRPYENNAKDHPQSQIEAIAKQIREFGFDVPIVITPEKLIIKGHGRWMAARLLEMPEVPCVVKEGKSEAQIIAARMADNRLQKTESDAQKLSQDFARLSLENFDLSLTGFEEKEISSFLNFQKKEEKEPSEKEDQTQFIVAVFCKDEADQAAFFQFMQSEGRQCKLIM